jgi:hypothetical protein
LSQRTLNLGILAHVDAGKTTIYIEHPAGPGEAVEHLGAPSNPFPAALGLRVDPAPAGSGVAFRLDVDVRSVPMYVYKTAGNFAEMMAQYVGQALQEGLSGWQVTDPLNRDEYMLQLAGRAAHPAHQHRRDR